MRILMDDVAVLERAGLGFIRVADQVDRFLLVLLDEAPFDATGESGPAPAAQSRSFHFVHDFGARHRDRLSQLLVTAVAQVAVDVRRVIVAPNVFENETVFEGVREGLRLEV